MTKKIREVESAILKWNGSSGTLESDFQYLECLMTIIFGETKEADNSISDKEKLSRIFDLINTYLIDGRNVKNTIREIEILLIC